MTAPDSLDAVRPSLPHRGWRVGAAVGLLLVLVCAGLWTLQMRRADLERRLLATPAAEAATHPDLVRYAAEQAKPLFARNCAACHGADMKGRPGTGAPNLTDKVWLYEGDPDAIELTLLYGIRSEKKKSRNVTEMPAFGQRGTLNDADIRNVVQYVLALSNRPNNAQAAELGQAVFTGPAACNDCHGSDGQGNPDYGATDLTANVWDYGGDPGALYDSIYFGRHGVMPGFLGKLTLEQIRALAIYVHASSQK